MKEGEYKNYLIEPDIGDMLDELDNGRSIGESCGILALADNFAWVRTFQNCFTGHPGFGKTTFLMMILLVKSMRDGWKHCIWTPEMMSSKNGKVTVNDFFDDLVHMYTGKMTDKIKAEKYETEYCEKGEYRSALNFLKEHFYVIFPRKQSADDVIATYNYFYPLYHFDTLSLDPFKSLIHSASNKLHSFYMEEIFAKFKHVAIEKDCVINWVAHPRSDGNFRNQDGSFRVCDQYMLSGGAAWNNSMDLVCSIHRPEIHTSPQSPKVQFFNLKTRKQQRSGIRPGMVDYIQFDWASERYWFGNTDAIGQSKNTRQINYGN